MSLAGYLSSADATTGDTTLRIGLLRAVCVLLLVALLGTVAILCVGLRAPGMVKLPTRRTSPDGDASR